MPDLGFAAVVLLSAFAGWRKGSMAPLFAVAVSLLASMRSTPVDVGFPGSPAR